MLFKLSCSTRSPKKRKETFFLFYFNPASLWISWCIMYNTLCFTFLEVLRFKELDTAPQCNVKSQSLIPSVCLSLRQLPIFIFVSAAHWSTDYFSSGLMIIFAYPIPPLPWIFSAQGAFWYSLLFLWKGSYKQVHYKLCVSNSETNWWLS